MLNKIIERTSEDYQYSSTRKNMITNRRLQQAMIIVMQPVNKKVLHQF